ncbi:solute carrier family 35 member G1-like [Ciona intestinalis]
MVNSSGLVGILCAVTSGFLSAIGAVLYKLTTDSAAPQVCLVRYGLTFGIFLPYLTIRTVRGLTHRINKKSALLMLTAAICTLVSSLTEYLAMDSLTAGDSITIGACSFIFTLVGGHIFLKEAFRLVSIIPVALSVAGVVFVARPSFIFGDDDITFGGSRIGGIFFAILSAIGGSAAMLQTRKLHNKATVEQIIIVPACMALVVLPAYSKLRNDGWYIPCLEDMVYLCGSASAYFASFSFILFALHKERAGPVSICYNLNIVFVFIIENVVFHTVPKTTSIIGAALVFIGSCAVTKLQMRQTGVQNVG